VNVSGSQPSRRSGETLRVLVAEDSWHYGQALEATLAQEGDIEVVGLAYTAEAALEAVARDAPDVVLLDLDLPEMGGVAACELLRARHPQVAVVVVTALADEETARQCLALGAHGYVVKHDRHDPERIAAAIRSAARGDHVLDRDVHELLVALSSRAPDPAAEAGITPRELEILPLVAEGLQNKEIAGQLGVSEQTVRNHLSSIYRKLGASNRTQMTREAQARGILR
jgi:DNA-binding NarL/FixJ family response regulator